MAYAKLSDTPAALITPAALAFIREFMAAVAATEQGAQTPHRACLRWSTDTKKITGEKMREFYEQIDVPAFKPFEDLTETQRAAYARFQDENWQTLPPHLSLGALEADRPCAGPVSDVDGLQIELVLEHLPVKDDGAPLVVDCDPKGELVLT